MKPLTLVIYLSVLITLIIGTCGCTSFVKTTNSSASPSVSPPPENLTTAIDNFYKQKNYTVNLPSYITKKGDTVTYHILVTDPQTVAPRYLTNVTVVLTTNRYSCRRTRHDIAQRQRRRAAPAIIHQAVTDLQDFNVTPPGQHEQLSPLRRTLRAGNDYLNEVADMTKYYQVTSAFGTPATT